MANGIDQVISEINRFYAGATYQQLVVAVTVNLSFPQVRTLMEMAGQAIDGVTLRRGWAFPPPLLENVAA